MVMEFHKGLAKEIVPHQQEKWGSPAFEVDGSVLLIVQTVV